MIGLCYTVSTLSSLHRALYLGVRRALAGKALSGARKKPANTS